MKNIILIMTLVVSSFGFGQQISLGNRGVSFRSYITTLSINLEHDNGAYSIFSAGYDFRHSNVKESISYAFASPFSPDEHWRLDARVGYTRWHKWVHDRDDDHGHEIPEDEKGPLKVKPFIDIGMTYYGSILYSDVHKFFVEARLPSSVGFGYLLNLDPIRINLKRENKVKEKKEVKEKKVKDIKVKRKKSPKIYNKRTKSKRRYKL